MRRTVMALLIAVVLVVSGCLAHNNGTAPSSRNITNSPTTGKIVSTGTETPVKCSKMEVNGSEIKRLREEVEGLNESLRECRANASFLSRSLNLTRSRLSELSSKYGECIARLSDLNKTAGELVDCRDELETVKEHLATCEKRESSLERNLTACRATLNRTYTEGTFELLTDRMYYQEVISAIDGATDTIYVMMFSMLYDPDDWSDEANDLIRALADAEYRGVRVHVLLENSVDYNREAYEYLRSSGVDVAFNSPSTTLHAKVVIIDGRIVFLGSHNWSESALHWNHEVSVKIVSRELAKSLIDYFWSVRS
jgi:phosphatidylserine/phosphatidylglycerophosphate/cardiolipin synthase-like enzyme